MMRKRGRLLLVLLLSAGLASVLSTVLAHQASRAAGRDSPMWLLALLNVTFWYGWALLALPLMALTNRLRIDRRPRIAVPVHIVAVVAAALAHIVLQTTSQVIGQWKYIGLVKPEFLVGKTLPGMWRDYFPGQLTQLIDWEFAIGVGMVGFAHAFFYYRESQLRAIREANLETRLVAAQLQTLQRQLHPHFLFNTLHAISALMHRDVQAADRMLAQLSDLLRLSLDSSRRAEIRLGDEIEFIEKYVEIEQVRLGERLSTRFEVDPQVLDAIVPALILQPLVENAIKHGIAPHSKPGRVTVSAHREGEMLVMTVEDTGPGPSERAMAALSTGIGVSNTRARLAHHYGREFRFEFQRHREGFAVLVAFPFRSEAPGTLLPAYVA
jgi:two-component system, LytTR family, sensor kinase